MFKAMMVKAWRWFPVLVITIDAACSYYVYVFQFCTFSPVPFYESFAYIFFFQILYMLFVWAFWRTIFTLHMPVPDQFKLTLGQEEELLNLDVEDRRKYLENVAMNLSVNCYTNNGTIRFCKRCCHFKPYRAHHCQICEQCILNSGHHCVFLNNCISITNYKYYVYFLGFSCMLCLFVFGTTLPYSIEFWKNKFGGPEMCYVLTLTIASGIFAIPIIGVFGYNSLMMILKSFYRYQSRRKNREFYRPYGRYVVVNDGPVRQIVTPL